MRLGGWGEGIDSQCYSLLSAIEQYEDLKFEHQGQHDAYIARVDCRTREAKARIAEHDAYIQRMDRLIAEAKASVAMFEAWAEERAQVAKFGPLPPEEDKSRK